MGPGQSLRQRSSDRSRIRTDLLGSLCVICLYHCTSAKIVTAKQHQGLKSDQTNSSTFVTLMIHSFILPSLHLPFSKNLRQRSSARSRFTTDLLVSLCVIVAVPLECSQDMPLPLPTRRSIYAAVHTQVQRNVSNVTVTELDYHHCPR